MEINAYTKQIRQYVVRAIIKGEIFITLVSIVFAFLNSGFWCLVQPYDCQFSFYMAYFSWRIILPAMLIVFVGGLIIGRFLLVLKNGASIILISILGLTISTIAIFAIDYVFWIVLQPRSYLGEYAFFEFAITKLTSDLLDFIFFINPFFIPSIIATASVLYIGWKINKHKLPDITI